MTAHPLGVGIVGMGGIGRMHAKALGELAGRARLVASSGGRAEDLMGGPVERLDPAEVIAHPDVDVVAICTPSGTHAALALAALKAGTSSSRSRSHWTSTTRCASRVPPVSAG